MQLIFDRRNDLKPIVMMLYINIIIYYTFASCIQGAREALTGGIREGLPHSTPAPPNTYSIIPKSEQVNENHF